jgi:hypothetical protein
VRRLRPTCNTRSTGGPPLFDDVYVAIYGEGCPVLAFFARAGSDAAHKLLSVLHNPGRVCVPGSRPLRSTQRTGHPLRLSPHRVQKRWPPALRMCQIQEKGGPARHNQNYGRRACASLLFAVDFREIGDAMIQRQLVYAQFHRPATRAPATISVDEIRHTFARRQFR